MKLYLTPEMQVKSGKIYEWASGYAHEEVTKGDTTVLITIPVKHKIEADFAGNRTIVSTFTML